MEALKRFLSIEMFLFALTALGGGVVAWTDVKSEIAVVQEKTEQNEKKYDKIDEKLDKIMNYLIEKNDNHNDGNG